MSPSPLGLPLSEQKQHSLSTASLLMHSLKGCFINTRVIPGIAKTWGGSGLRQTVSGNKKHAQIQPRASGTLWARLSLKSHRNCYQDGKQHYQLSFLPWVPNICPLLQREPSENLARWPICQKSKCGEVESTLCCTLEPVTTGTGRICLSSNSLKHEHKGTCTTTALKYQKPGLKPFNRRVRKLHHHGNAMEYHTTLQKKSSNLIDMNLKTLMLTGENVAEWSLLCTFSIHFQRTTRYWPSFSKSV